MWDALLIGRFRLRARTEEATNVVHIYYIGKSPARKTQHFYEKRLLEMTRSEHQHQRFLEYRKPISTLKFRIARKAQHMIICYTATPQVSEAIASFSHMRCWTAVLSASRAAAPPTPLLTLALDAGLGAQVVVYNPKRRDRPLAVSLVYSIAWALRAVRRSGKWNLTEE